MKISLSLGHYMKHSSTTEETGPPLSVLLWRLAVVLSVTLIAIPLGLASPAHATSSGSRNEINLTSVAPDDWHPEITASQHINGTPLASGSVLTPDNRIAEAELDMVLLAWPNQESMAQLEEGETFTRKPIAKGSTDSDGTYEVRLDPDVRLKEVTSSDGVINATMHVLAENAVGTRAFSIVDAKRHTDQQDLVTVDFETREPTLSTAGIKEDVVLRQIPDRQHRSNITPQDHIGNECVLSEDIGTRWTTVGTGYLWTDDATFGYDYTSSATVTTGYGYSVTGDYGDFTQEGTHTYSSETTLGWLLDWQTGRHFQTQYMISRYTCYYLLVTATVVTPRYHYGGQRAEIRGTSQGVYCADHGQGSDDFVKTTTTATTSSNGVRVSAIIGIDLTSRSGYTTQSRVTISFEPRATVCGASGAPAASPGRLAVRDYGT